MGELQDGVTYRCKHCGWTGTTDDMGGDYSDEMDEFWSNTICPQCGLGWDVENFEPARQDT